MWTFRNSKSQMWTFSKVNAKCRHIFECEHLPQKKEECEVIIFSNATCEHKPEKKEECEVVFLKRIECEAENAECGFISWKNQGRV